ncbi:hypothetical protein V7200_09530 [Cytobacillus firmus]|uniref:aconitate hydratase n=1 Tax=Cytobacillus firmus TaxID=1399 RepID=A0A800NE59_CYTFI|nr:hypothetical protein [Cytobacillus firmus]KAF0825214.1 hypothetical protein KIS1582_1001 [Cytobacillus firmus]
MNILEKRLADLANLPSVTPGDQIHLTPDCVFVSGQSSSNVIKAFNRLGFKNVENSARIVFSHGKAEDEEIRQFCKEKGIRVIDCDLPEHFRAENKLLHGMVIAVIDEDMKCLGGRGAIPIVISPDSMAACLSAGSFTMFIPESVYIEINGALSGKVNGKMLCSYLVNIFEDSLIGNAVILGGKVLEQLNTDDLKELSYFFQLSGTAVGICSPGGPFGQVESVIKIKSDAIT